MGKKFKVKNDPIIEKKRKFKRRYKQEQPEEVEEEEDVPIFSQTNVISSKLQQKKKSFFDNFMNQFGLPEEGNV